MDSYGLRRDADTIAKFVAKVTNHGLKLELYRDGLYGFPRPIPKNAKWPAYEAAYRIEKALYLHGHASSVPELAQVLSHALAAINRVTVAV